MKQANVLRGGGGRRGLACCASHASRASFIIVLDLQDRKTCMTCTTIYYLRKSELRHP